MPKLLCQKCLKSSLWLQEARTAPCCPHCNTTIQITNEKPRLSLCLRDRELKWLPGKRWLLAGVFCFFLLGFGVLWPWLKLLVEQINGPVYPWLPTRSAASVPTRLPQTLAEVPEVSLEDPHDSSLSAHAASEHMVQLIEKINQVNRIKTDAFIKALTTKRSDLNGLPFTMGHNCRLPTERGRQFQTELGLLRRAMGNPANLARSLPDPTGQRNDEAAIQARIAALVQVVGPEGAQLGQEMVRYVARLSHIGATRALARLAVFSEDNTVQQDAVAALEGRRGEDVSDILVAGLNYPWPPVAQRAAVTIVKLKRVDLIPQLVEVLEMPDPRLPQTREKDGKTFQVMRELVRINHLRNCLLCHSPASGTRVDVIQRGGRGRSVAEDSLTAPVPIPGASQWQRPRRAAVTGSLPTPISPICWCPST